MRRFSPYSSNHVSRTRGLRTALFLAVLLSSDPSFAVSDGHVDDFENGTTQGWSEGGASPNPPQNIPNDGPGGAGDNYLRNISTGSSGSGGKQLIINSGVNWTGDFATAGIEVIRLDVRVTVASAGPVSLRVTFVSTAGARFVSTDAVLVPDDGIWHEVSIPFTEATMTQVVAGQTFGQAAAAVNEVRIIHRPNLSNDANDRKGANFNGTVGYDNISTLSTPAPPPSPSRDVTSFDDVTGDTVPDVGSFIGDELSRPTLAVYSGASGALHSTYSFLNDAWQAVAVSTARDGNQDGTAVDPAAAVLAVNRETGRIRVQTQRLDTATSVSSIQFFNQSWRAVDVVVVDDMNGDGNTNDSAIAVLAERLSDGRIQLQLRDLTSGSLISNVVYLNARWTPVAAAVADRSAVAPAGTLPPLIGVIAEKAEDGKRTMQSRVAGSGSFDQNIKFLGSAWNYHDVSVNHDANSDGTNDDPVWQVLATRASDDVIRVQSRFVADGSFDSNIVILSSAWEARRFDTAPDISGNVSREMAVTAIRRADDVERIHVKDFASRTTTINISP